ncbi:hypothetical protein [Enterobacter hormaechei]|uniref:hypothetical protein n=1 Tax=Enterobacter hormaechei TaxID=158836 RepID=UPI000794C010|nr:hypothetical protein [Enterobacter hormaechei]SAD38055.1 Uncharacterised protein [Enterobacter hormaechei]SAD56037.1 Uncharacterised protein [Enterobacter hormaechei]SAF80986.1 Uncharacterised protein [Enterobacter hormaechei]
MKTPINMLEDIAAEITESTSLLEVIFRISELPPEADNALACLIRSMMKTSQTAYEYVEQLSMQDGTESQRVQQLEPPAELARKLNSWACDIGNCKSAIFTTIDSMQTDLHCNGALSIVSEKLDELQNVISSKADKIELIK